MSTIVTIESISQLHDFLGYKNTQHPLITLIDYSKITRHDFFSGIQINTAFYSITLKSANLCKIKYGRQNYDFHEGSLIFMAPGQIFSSATNMEDSGHNGWSLVFHPDLIRKSTLATKINSYSYFSYESNEALHLSNREKEIITGIVKNIKDEVNLNLDVYSQDLILSHIELLLNYCKRFYGRQFITRTHINKDIVSKFEMLLETYFTTGKPRTHGLPSVRYCAKQMGYSPNYLSDLLKKETGKNAQEHIHFYLIEKAKNMLLGTEEPIYNIAYTLGFEYPQHFSKLFKKKTGMSPMSYRL